MQEYASPSERWAFLAPWTARLRDRDVRVKVKYANDHTYRSSFDAVEITLEDGIADDHDASALAEAVALVATALARCPDAWPVLLVDQCECAGFFNPNNEPLVARVEFDCSMFGADDLSPGTGQRFFHELMGGGLPHRSRSHAYTEAWEQLGLLAPSSVAETSPVGITIRLTMDNRDADHEVYAAFVDALEQYSRPGENHSWCVLETIDLDGAELGTSKTYDVVDRARGLVAKQPLVRVSRVTIHPADVHNTTVDLRTFLTILAHAYADLEVEISGLCSSYPHTFNQTEWDRRIALVMQTIAEAGVSIKCLHVGQVSPQHQSSRRALWEHLFGTILHPAAASTVDHLVINSHGLLESGADADLITEASVRCADFRTPPTLTLMLADANPPSVQAIISAFAGELRHLCVVDSQQPIPCETVEFIVRTCPRLWSLDLNNVALDSMNIFCAHPCRLSCLALTNLTLTHRASIQAFLNQLADSNSSLSRHLVEFRLARVGDPAAMWNKLVLNNTTDFTAFRRVLRANERLHTLYVEVEDDTPHWLIADMMRTHRKSVAVRQAPLALACKLAWLSATKGGSLPLSSSPRHCLSHDVIRHIFEYAAECMLRWVYVGKSFE